MACLPGIVEAAYALPDAHWGYGFPIGGVAAFDPAEGGVISAGGVGFDIACGVRLLRTGLTRAELEPVRTALADALFATIPVGLGRGGALLWMPCWRRRMSQHEAVRRWQERAVVDDLADRGVLIHSPSLRGMAEEAPGLIRNVARLLPRICIQGWECPGRFR